MLEKIVIYTISIIVIIPILLWFAMRELFTGGLKLVCFVCKRQYLQLKHLCECGTSAELQAFLTAHPGAKDYIVYTREDKTTSIVTTLFKLPAPLAVAVHANNMAVIPVLLANGASPEVRSISAEQSPAEEAIGDPEKMHALCGGKTWWLERTNQNDALNTGNCRSLIWNVMRGARLTSHEQLCKVSFLRLPIVMKEFVCRFGIAEKQRGEFYSQLKTLTPEEQKQITTLHFNSPFGYRSISLHENFTKMMQVLEKTQQPLPTVDDDAMERLMFSAGLMDREKMLELLDILFSLDQQFALLDRFTRVPPAKDNRELTEDVVELLLGSLLKKAGEKA